MKAKLQESGRRLKTVHLQPVIAESRLWALNVATVLGAAAWDVPGPLYHINQQGAFNVDNRETYVLISTIAIAVEGLWGFEDHNVEAVDLISVLSQPLKLFLFLSRIGRT